MKTKHEMREAAVERLNEMYETGPYTTQDIVVALAGSSGWVGRIIDLLTDDDTGDYMQLPVDADGEVIHIGDEMVVGDHRYIVDGVGLADSTEVFFVTDGDKSEGFPAKVCRHYHKSTVEDVLREFADEVQRCCDTEDTITEYAKKLQLKED